MSTSRNAEPSNTMIAARDLSFRYGEEGFRLAVPHLELARGETLAIVGPSGSGKTTLLLLLAGIYLPESGSIRIGPATVTQLSDRDRRRFRSREVGFVFQDFQLLDYLNVRENILLPFYLQGGRLESADREYAEQLMAELGIAGLEDRAIDQLSQGERQRVATCRALVTRPHVILADEPTGNLDPTNKLQTMQRLREHAARQDSALIVVTHDVGLLDGFDRVLDLSEQSERGEEESPPRETDERGAEGRGEQDLALDDALEPAEPSASPPRDSHGYRLRHAFLLARRYLAHHRLRSVIVVACLVLSLYLPLANRWAVDRFASQLTARAQATPMVVGAAGSRFDVVLHALYFDPPLSKTLTMAEAREVEASGYGRAIPLFVAHTARDAPVVGTTLDYFDFRELTFQSGGAGVRLGDCVLGSAFARRHGLGPGDQLLSDARNVFNLAGEYPLSMRVRGVLAPTSTRDDDAVFCDIKTAWLIHGIGHGHQDLAQVPAPDEESESGDGGSLLLDSQDGALVASAAVTPYLEITEENLDTFHFHGDPDTYPVTALLVVPDDARSFDLLLGRYVGREQTQALIPDEVIGQVVALVFRVKRLVDVAAWLVLAVTGLFLLLVLLLTLSLRRGEMQTMYKLGCSRFMMVRLQTVELVLLLAISAMVAGPLAWLTARVAPGLLERWLVP